MDEICRRLEVNIQVEVRGVVRGDPAVHEAAAVEGLVPDAAPFGVRGIQNVSYSQLLQGGLVVRHGPAGETQVRDRGTQKVKLISYSRVADVDFGPDFVHFMEVQLARVQQLLQVLHRQIFFPLSLLQR